METFWIKAVQLMLSLSLLVVIHEGGHFLFAKLFKTRVEKFRLFFDPWFTIFKFKPKNSETEYGLGWIPLGGYVKIAGMIATCSALGVPRQARLAATAYHDWWCIVQLPTGSVHLFDDSLCLGRFIHPGTKSPIGYAV